MNGYKQTLFCRLWRLPAQDIPNILGLALADNKFLSVVQGHQPALAGNHAHFPDLLHVDQSVPVNSAEGTVPEAILNGFEILGG